MRGCFGEILSARIVQRQRNDRFRIVVRERRLGVGHIGAGQDRLFLDEVTDGRIVVRVDDLAVGRRRSTNGVIRPHRAVDSAEREIAPNAENVFQKLRVVDARNFDPDLIAVFRFDEGLAISQFLEALAHDVRRELELPSSRILHLQDQARAAGEIQPEGDLLLWQEAWQFGQRFTREKVGGSDDEAHENREPDQGRFPA